MENPENVRNEEYFQSPILYRVFLVTLALSGEKREFTLGKVSYTIYQNESVALFRYYFRLRIINKSTTCDVIYKEGTGRKCSLTGK